MGIFEEKISTLNKLVGRFRNNISQYTDKNYKEQRLRMDFVDQFFELLDWDISNKEGAIEEFRDVVIEDNLEISGTQKYPDYTFRIGNEPVFFVETKKPSISLKNSNDPAYQVRRYGYTAKRKISILTDFDEFAIYDTRIKPGKNDKASIARLFYCTYDEYEKNWEFLCELLSKDAVKKGSINNYVGKGTKKGVSEVDKDFLKLIEGWRSELAKNIAKNNKKAEIDPINMAVQKIIDRIIFLRICEEKGIEQFENLQNIGNDKAVYGKLAAYFDKANKKYNSELFKPDEAINSLDIEDDILKDIIKGLYYPECPYAFSVLPVDILGNIYEQFLGKTIRLTESHLAKIEEKPEVRKAGGVYYTPKYIVDYIVKNTVGEKIKGLTPKEIEKIKILDPACGSGSFLLGAYTALLNYHLIYYTKKENLAKAIKHEVIYQSKKDSYRLTIKEKQKILLNNLFGVDIDAQAVEVTKLSLMLKLLEGEGDESAGMLFKYSDTKLLPTLSGNIKCGNSLIGPDFYKDKNLSLFDDEEMKKVNVFDWNDNEKGFGEIMANGGFDCVIGNPPWGAEFTVNEKECLVKEFPIVPLKTKDSYFYFIFKGINLLINKGCLGYIIPNTWLLINNADNIRKKLLELDIRIIIDYGDGVFKDATVESSVLVLSKSSTQVSECKIIKYRKGEKIIESTLPKSIWANDGLCRIILEMDSTKKTLLSKLTKDNVPFKDCCSIVWGIKPYQVGHGKPPQTKEDLERRIFHSDKPQGKTWKPLVVGSNINRYSVVFPGNQYIKYGEWLMYKSDEALICKPKILLRQTSDKLRAGYDDDDYYPQNSVFIISSDVYNLKCLLALLNSRLFDFIYGLGNPQSGKVFAEIKPSIIKSLPIKTIDSSCANNKQLKIVALVDQMLETQKNAHSAKTESDKKHYQQKIDILDKQIDELVYALYELTEGEIKIIEGGK